MCYWYSMTYQLDNSRWGTSRIPLVTNVVPLVTNVVPVVTNVYGVCGFAHEPTHTRKKEETECLVDKVVRQVLATEI